MGEPTPGVGADARRRRLEAWLSVVLVIAAADTVYLSWRFAALYAGWVVPGTGLCSWGERVDCDKVLRTPQARAFVVPNAVLGAGFYTGAVLWWFLGRRLGPAYRPHLVRSLAVWLGVASLLTLWFWRLLVRLEALCPFCPWNHVLTYVALYLAVRVWRLTPHPAHHQPLRPLLRLVVFCVAWFWAWQGFWFAAEATVLQQHARGQSGPAGHTRRATNSGNATGATLRSDPAAAPDPAGGQARCCGAVRVPTLFGSRGPVSTGRVDAIAGRSVVDLPAGSRQFLLTDNGGIPNPDAFAIPGGRLGMVGVAYGSVRSGPRDRSSNSNSRPGTDRCPRFRRDLPEPGGRLLLFLLFPMLPEFFP